MLNKWLWLVVLTAAAPSFICQLENGGKIWVLLVAGSNSYYNYRHQADVCHSYQILHENGIPNENIIVMMYDDIVYNPENPTPGIIINHPNGSDVYKGVPKDYTNKEVTPENFLNILSGNVRAMNGIGSGRVVKSGPRDNIFVYFADHGAPGLIAFPNSFLYATELEKTLRSMADNDQFAKMVLYVEACESGSMFENILPDNLNIFVVTAADPHESSYACYYDEIRETYLGDVFSVNWMQDAEKENLLVESLHHQFEVVRAVTNTSHVEEYGDLDLGSLYLSEFIGFRLSKALPQKGYRDPLRDAVSSRDVPVAILERRLEAAVDRKEKNRIAFELHKMIKLRHHLDLVVEDIMSKAFGEEKYEDWGVSTYRLNKQNFGCYKHLLTQFSKWCFDLSENPYALSHLHKFAGVCSGQFRATNETTTAAAIRSVCSSRILESGVV